MQTVHISYWFDGVVGATVVACQFQIYRWIRRALVKRLAPGQVKLACAALLAFLAAPLLVIELNSESYFWQPLPFTGRAAAFAAGIWVAGSTGAVLLLAAGAFLRRVPTRAASNPRSRGGFVAGRRRLLETAVQAAAALAPFGVAGYGTLIVRKNFLLRERDFPVSGLHPDLEGLRMALLSDIHLSPYLSLPELDRVIAMANETRPHIALVTGDLITRQGDPLETCLARLARLRADAGVFGCLGNHEVYADCQDLAATWGRALGIEFLRLEHRVLRFGNAHLNIAGVDYQRQRRPYLVGAEWLLEPGTVNLLLSHNPDVFPVASRLGYDLVVGGHTHGGQVTIEILEQTLNASRFFTPYVAGLYRRPGSALYVSRGIGTINLPMRLGATPEVAVLRLRRA
jgi:predicted MPP superfamily phosphohydrolase